MAIRLKEIAALAGVSESTVSRALNNSPLISEKTRQAVFEAARRLHYQTGRIHTIGVIEPKITNPLYGEVIEAIELRAYEAGFGLLLCDSAFDLKREQDQVDFLLRQGGVQGLILIPIDPEAGHIRALTRDTIPCVILGTDPVMGSDQVNVDAAMGAYLATRHLVDLGHRRIGILQGPEQISACRARRQGYCQALAEAGVGFDPRLVAVAEVEEAGGARAMQQLLPLAGEGLTAVYAINDAMALGALRRLREEGLRVPEDVSLAGCDDIPVAAQVQPALTTVWQPKSELGLLAARLLLKQIETRKERGECWKECYPFQSAMFHPRMVVRESTRKWEGRGS
jgi:LacI family transcriptional regulator